MPVTLLNEQVNYEHGGNPFKGLHRWYSRKPLSFSRASVLASLLPADLSVEEFAYLLGVYSQGELEFLQQSNLSKEEKEEKIKSKVRLYKTPPGSQRIQKVHDYCEKTWGKRTPVVLDAFAGGGSIPFEAARYGLQVYASDLNPVAVVTMKAAMEYPLRFGPDLQEDIDRWVQWVGDEAQKRLGEFFPSPEGETVQNYLWAHTVQCPSCSSTVPLSPNWWLSKTSNYAGKGKARKVTSDWYAVKPIPNPKEKRVDFELIKGRKGKGSTILYNPAETEQSAVVRASRSLANPSNEKEKPNALGDIEDGENKDVVRASRSLANPSIENGENNDVVRASRSLGDVEDGENKDVVRASRSLGDIEDGENNDVVRASRSLGDIEDGENKDVVGASRSLGGDVSEQDARTTNKNDLLEFNPKDYSTISRSVGKCPNCGSVIENEYIASPSQKSKLGHQIYAVAFKKGKGSLEFRTVRDIDLEGIKLAEQKITQKMDDWEALGLISHDPTPTNPQYSMIRNYGIVEWHQCFNPRQLLTLVTYVEIINEAKAKIREECKTEKTEQIASVQDDFEAVAELEDYYQAKIEAISTYLILMLDRCIDKNSRLSHWQAGRIGPKRATTQHALNLFWCYPETNGARELWDSNVSNFASEYQQICQLFGTKPHSTGLPGIEKHDPKTIQIDAVSADSLFHIPDNSVDAIITDPPYYGTVPYADLADFFYVWQKRVLGDIFPQLFFTDLTDKDREAVANPSRFRNMGTSPDDLANQDYEAKMALAFADHYRVLRDDGIMTVQFNHKESGAWDVLAKSLIDAGFEITASWAVSTENPQNLHQAKKNSVSSTVLLVCRKREPNAGQAWWDDLRPEVANLVESRAPDYEANDITGIDLYLSAFGPALNVFSRQYPILDSSGQEVRPEEAFAEARVAIANYRFRNLVQTETAGFDPLTQWYLLAWDAFKAREFPFDEARQLALAIGGFNVSDLAKTHKLLDSASGTCKLLTPQQRLKKRAFSLKEQEFESQYLVDGLHAIIAIYAEEENLQLVRRFLKNTGLVSNDLFMKTLEVAFKVIPDKTPEYQTLLNLWLGMDEIKAKVVVKQMELNLEGGGQLNLFDE